MAKKPAATKKPALKKVAVKKAEAVNPTEGSATPKKAAKPKRKAGPKAPAVNTLVHGETRLMCTDEAGMAWFDILVPLVDAVHALGSVKVTSATVRNDTAMLHAVLPDHPQPYDRYPGLILAIDMNSRLMSFDHVVIGHATAETVVDAAFTLLHAMESNEDHPANDIGRRADWFEMAVVTAEKISARLITP